MSQNLEQFQITEKIKLSYLKNRGNVLEMSKELNLPLEYLQKMVWKFRGKESRDVATLISNTLMQHLMLGHESRVTHLMSMLKSLENRDQLVVSTCCESVVEKNDKDNYVCLACRGECKVKILDKEGIFDLKLGILEQLREEDKSLVEFASKMGYTQRQELPAPPTTKINNNILVMPGANVNKETIENISKLSPMERDILIGKLEKEIIQGEIINPEGQNGSISK